MIGGGRTGAGGSRRGESGADSRGGCEHRSREDREWTHTCRGRCLSSHAGEATEVRRPDGEGSVNATGRGGERAANRARRLKLATGHQVRRSLFKSKREPSDNAQLLRSCRRIFARLADHESLIA